MARRFFTSILLCFIIVSIVPVVLLGYVAMTVSSHASMREIEGQISTLSSGAAKSIDSMLSLFEDGLRLFSEDPDVRTLLSSEHEEDTQTVYRKMYLLLSGHSDTCSMHVVSKSGSIALSTGTLPPQYDPLGFDSWGLLRLLSDSSTVQIYANRMETRNTLSVGKSIHDDDGNLLGYAIVDVPAQSVIDRLDELTTTLPFLFGMVDAHGFVVFDQIGISGETPFVSEHWDTGSAVQETTLKGKRLKLNALTLRSGALVLLSAVPVDLVIESNNRIMMITILFALLSIVLSVLFSLGFAHNLSGPVTQMSRMMEKVGGGDMEARSNVDGNGELADLSRKLNKMVDQLDALFHENLEKQDLLRDAELKSLKAQIDPHFLYNTLDCIRYMVKLGMQQEASIAISDLGVLLKHSIGNRQDMNTLSDALHVIQSYLGIVHLQHPDKFITSIDVDPAVQNVLLPKLLLQPLVENAVVHGLEEKVGVGHLSVTAKRQGDNVVFTVQDDGVGMDAETLQNVSNGKDEGVGIQNVRQRLLLFYGNHASLVITSVPNVGTEVTMTIPLGETKKEADVSGGRG